MNRLLSFLGIAITLAYFAFAYWLFAARWTEIKALPPNGIGDFLAGTFGPLTIVWLVLGFFQQGQELRQNTEALELQAAELKNSVDQQRELVRLSSEQLTSYREELETERKKTIEAATPRFVFVSRGRTSVGRIATHHFAIVNTGAPAAKVILRTSNQIVELSQSEITVFEPYGERSVDITFLDQKTRSGFTLTVACLNATGMRFTWNYDILVDQSGCIQEIQASAA